MKKATDMTKKANIQYGHLIAVLLVFFYPLSIVHAQYSEVEFSQEDRDAMIEWVHNLYTPGVSMNDDTLHTSEEFDRVLNDEAYFNMIYPEKYTWEVTQALIQKQAIKQALWYMINLYSQGPKNKELVVKSVLYYSKLFDMEKLLTSSFYSYCYLDPEISTIEEGKPIVKAPHVMEEKLLDVREILGYVQAYIKMHSENN